MSTMHSNNSSNNSNKSISAATTCVVCLHQRREEFDRALALGQVTPAHVAREIGCHRSSVTRHKQRHVLPEVSQQVHHDSELADIDILTELKGLYRRMRSHLERAENTDNWQAIRGFSAEARQDLEMLAKLLGDLDSGPQVNVWLPAPWPEIERVIAEALAPYPQAATAVAARLVLLEESGRHHAQLN